MSLSPSKFENILVMGKSGAGKQPRIDVFKTDFGLTQLSTGNIFRSFMKIFKDAAYEDDINQFYDDNKNSFIPDDKIKGILGSGIDNSIIDDFLLGLKAHYYVSNGKYVPDSLTNMLFESYFSKSDYKGMVLDGYPRTVAQAEYLLQLTSEKGTKIDAIVLVENEDDAIIKRTMGRRICPSCGAVFHLEFKPPKEGKFCTKCETEVILRSDDTEEKLRTRLKEFRDKTMPTINFLSKKGIPVVKVEGNLPVFTEEAVKQSVVDGLKEAGLL
ncbi:MAG: nucleoside monophosphate kinase [Spirochaetota bacterium]|nr:nucleoside monophosphate kinase [Spirochaetota bacterium]